MLVLTRKIDEDILIGPEGPDQIVIRVIDIRHRRSVKIGIQAPRHILVQRREIAGKPPKKKGGSRASDTTDAHRSK